MKLYAICLVKDEDDVIAQTLSFATGYCDKIFVIDNGSTDRTWEIVNGMAARDDRIVPFMQTFEPYHDGLRWMAYDAYHRELSNSDWWLALDGDEFLAEDPRPIIDQAIREEADIIKAWQIQFYYTEVDYQAWKEGRDSRELAIFERRRYYRIDWQEPRLFRNQTEPYVVFAQSKISQAREACGAAVVRRAGKLCRRQIFNRHYQYRDPPQIEKRLRLRYGVPQFRTQVRSKDWSSVIRASRKLDYYVEGMPWHFSLSGLVHAYRGRIRHGMGRRYRQARGYVSALAYRGVGRWE